MCMVLWIAGLAALTRFHVTHYCKIDVVCKRNSHILENRNAFVTRDNVMGLLHLGLVQLSKP